MAANPTIYCLEKITDYSQFESLCHDLMAHHDYPNIEPLGGFSDKGRDAIHVDRSNKVTVFAYSVREDWKQKLKEDSAKVRTHGHSCHRFVFVTTASLTASEKDQSKATIKEEFGWQLEVYDIERLRIWLDVEQCINRKVEAFLFTLNEEDVTTAAHDFE